MLCLALHAHTSWYLQPCDGLFTGTVIGMKAANNSARGPAASQWFGGAAVVRGCPGKARERAPPTPSQPTLCGGRRPGAWSRGLIWATTFRCPSPPYFSFIVSPHEQHHTHTSSRSHFTIAQSSPTPSAAKRPKINPAMSFVVRPSQPCPLPDHTPHVFVPSVAPPLVPTPTLQRVGAVSVVLADTEPLLLLLSVALCRKWHPTATFRTRTCPMACSPRRPMYADDSAHTHARTPTHPALVWFVPLGRSGIVAPTAHFRL